MLERNRLMMIPMELREIQLVDDPRQSQVVILGEREGDRAFPIFIGLAEAAAMDSAVRSYVSPRPFTHDLILNVIQDLRVSLEEVQVDDLRDNTFYGKLVLKTANGEKVLVDARPSDALVLAMKTKAPIYVADHVLDVVCSPSEESSDGEE